MPYFLFPSRAPVLGMDARGPSSSSAFRPRSRLHLDRNLSRIVLSIHSGLNKCSDGGCIGASFVSVPVSQILFDITLPSTPSFPSRFFSSTHLSYQHDTINIDTYRIVASSSLSLPLRGPMSQCCLLLSSPLYSRFVWKPFAAWWCSAKMLLPKCVVVLKC